MPLANFPQAVVCFELQVYHRPSDEKQLRDTHIAFSGAPQKHPTNPKKILLVVDPYSDNTFYYEFNTQDISYVEELANLVTMDGEVIPMARLWIKKKSIAIRSTPFVVESTRP
ncbi:inorganic pyrophosphatase Ppa [Thiovibrio frasassiensis]|jgi:inorganic pyrophosphatase|uniref:Inorganic pyrophosphatase Ppa n=1 Tax=Thiovibrio frasassiensis TaxID=2984131 RepID=A0A9X4MHM5_9BACT|nr:inorganic pyrophosphatase Ppa [Thiovibrio frasassiensis]MDG4476020.1 inorganic pyrophosphatase Ppa [Thiovibrio frasassiensis]